ncbi:hypothetical protein [Phaeacidiphilus oryzae]|uniref:hypothetical protein n=1 Tax=Phaeacidiphilus oryzae TaxID=348818 RepID=UPI00068FAF44|nr:hypothetical protein [Phaeacidiphilus oryzae]
MRIRPRPPFAATTALAATLLLAAAGACAGAALRAHRPPPFGDHIELRTSRPAAEGGVRPRGDALEGPGWLYRRTPHGSAQPPVTPADAVRGGPGAVVGVWSDGMLTAVDPRGPRPRVSWHRFVPGLALWLRARPAGTPVVLPAGPGLLVVTPGLVMDFRTRDGNLRWDTAAGPGCRYLPQRMLVTDGSVVLPRACPGGGPGGSAGAGHSTVEAFDGAGRRWQIAAGPHARPSLFTGTAVPPPHPPAFRPPMLGTPPRVYQDALGRRLIEIADLPLPAVRPLVVDADTGRRLPPCAAATARLLAGGCADPRPARPRPAGPRTEAPQGKTG